MSRYVHLPCPTLTRAQLEEQLRTSGIEHEVAGRRRLMLQGSLECAGEPVDIRCRAGTLGTVEDFGFVATPEGIRLVVGDVDRGLVESELLGPMLANVAEAKVRAAAARGGLTVEEIAVEADGTRRLVLKR